MIEIKEIKVSERPEFIVIKPSINKPPIAASDSKIPYEQIMQIPAGESQIFPVYVSSGDQVRPGKHTLIFNVLFQRTFNGETQTGSLIAKHQFEIKVFGEGEILGAITNVSSFLLLPGFLMIIVLGMTWKLFVPGAMKDKLAVKKSWLTDARFWLLIFRPNTSHCEGPQHRSLGIEGRNYLDFVDCRYNIKYR